MPRDAAHLSEVIHLIYNASLHPEQWNNVVAAIAATMGSSKAVLFTPYLAPQHGGFYFQTGFSERDAQLWATSYIKQDIRAARMLKLGLVREGVVVLDTDLIPQKDYLASPYYRDFMRTMPGVGSVCVGVVFAGSPDFPAVTLPVHRSLHEPFDEQDVAWMKLIIPHISRSMGLMMRLNTARVQHASLLASFDRLSFGVVLLNAQMQVAHLNQAARTVIDRADGLFINPQQHLECVPDAAWLQHPAPRTAQGHARTHRNGTVPSLSRWLMDLRDAPLTDPHHFMEGCMVERRGSGKTNQCYVLQCAPVPASNGDAGAWHVGGQGGKQVRFAVFITDPQAVQLPSTERLRELYGLTPAQAKVAREFARGHSYKQVAQSLNISEDTVRAHVKHIYPKTHVNRQSDLVRLVLSISTSGV